MLPYVILMFAPLLLYQISLTKDDKSNREGWFISIGKEPRILNNSLIVPAFFLLLILLLSCRSEMVGKDLLIYKDKFETAAIYSFRSTLKVEEDTLFSVMNWVIRQFTDSFQVYLTIVALITVLPIAMIYSDDKQYGFLKIVLFMNMSVFIMIFSGLRQSLAISIGMIAYKYVKEKKPLRFLLFALIAWGFHHTGFMILLYYPLYHLRLQKNQRWFAIPFVATIFAFNKQIFGWLTDVASSVFGDRYDVEVQETGAYLMIILFVLFAIAAFFFPDDEKMDDETVGLRNFLLMTVLLQCFAPVHNLAMRMNYYFIVFVPITVPKILKYSKDNIKDVAKIAKIVIVGFFVAYYLYTTYVSCKTGISTLGTYPYIPFWK